MTTSQPTSAPVAWKRVALFYGIAFGGACLLAAGLWFAGAKLLPGQATPLYQSILAVLYMPLPLVAGLITEKVAKRHTLLRGEGRRLISGFGRVALVSASSTVLVFLALMGLSWLLGNVLGVPGVGELAHQKSQVIENISALLPAGTPAPEESSVPTLPLMYALAVFSGLIAGFTINGLFAFGEEYGWRGVLMDELAPLGPTKANLLTGVLWGLWHAPIIALGFNYGTQPLWGSVLMVAWVTPFSFILWRSREYSGSIAAPAIIHGAFNGSAGFYVFLVAGRSELIAAPVGAVAALALAIVALVVWRLFKPAVAAADYTAPSHSA